MVSLAVIEILKPLLQATVLTFVLQSKYGTSFAAHFPQLSDFSHRHVLDDAEFTHAHWAELTRVLTSPAEATGPGGDERLGTATRVPIAVHSTKGAISGG